MDSTPTTAREALDNLLEAFEQHYSAAQNCDSILDDEIVTAEEQLQDAFFIYDNVLFNESGIELPFDIMDEDEELMGSSHDGALVLADDDYDEDEDDLDDDDYDYDFDEDDDYDYDEEDDED